MMHSMMMILGIMTAGVLEGEASEQHSSNTRVEWLREHVIEFESADPVHQVNDDLIPLIDLFKSARVVQLGEQTHGDGTAFLLRSRLIKFLHDRLEFDTLAFESGFYECRAVDAALTDADVSLHDAIDQGVYSIWGESLQIQPLFSFLRETRATGHPMSFFGFDVQFSRDSTRDRLSRDLFAFLNQAVDTSLNEEIHAQIDSIIQAIASAGQTKIDDATHARNRQALDEIGNAIKSADKSDRDRQWWSQIIIGLEHMEQSVYYGSLAPPFDPTNIEASVRSPYRILASVERDLGMAENLQWWLDHDGREKKMIVWAANNHVAYNSRREAIKHLPRKVTPPLVVPAGSHLRDTLGDRVYTILTVPYTGAWAAPSIRTAAGELRWINGDYSPDDFNSLAALLHQTGAAYALLDLRSIRNDPEHWLNQPIVIRSGMFNGEAVIPANYCDGILFIDVMKPSTPRNASPAGR